MKTRQVGMIMQIPASGCQDRVGRKNRNAALVLVAAALVGLAAPLTEGATVTWNGSPDTTWTQPDDTNSWSANYATGDTVQFLGAGAGTVTISGTVTPGPVTVNSTSPSNYTFSGGAITSSGALTKSGTSTLTLTNANSYSSVAISDGTLQVGNAGASGSLGSGTVALSGTGNVVFKRSDNQTITNTFTWTGTSTTQGSLTHSGAGTLALQGNQTLRRLATGTGAGALTVSGGTLRLGVSGQYVAEIAAGAGSSITVTGALAEIAGGQPFLYKGGSGTVYLGNATSVGFAISGPTIGGPVIWAGALDIVGSLQSNLLARRFIFGGTTNDVLQFSGTLTSSLGQTSGQLGWFTNACDGGFAARTAPATVNIGGSSATLFYQNPGTFAAYGFLASGRTLVFGSETSDNLVTLQNPLNLFGATQTITVIGNANPNNAAELSGALANGGLTKTGTGKLTLSNAASSYTGVTIVSSGILNVSTFAAGGSNSSIGAATTAATNLVLNGGTLQHSAANAASTNRLFSVGSSGGTIDSSATLVANSLTFTGTGAMGFNSQTGARTLTLTGSNAGANTLALAIGDNSGATSLTKSGTGKWILTNTNGYTGPTTISGGTLALGTSATMGSSSIVVGDTGSSGAVLDLTAKSSYSFASGTTLQGIGTVNLGSGKTLTLAGNVVPGHSVGTLHITGDVATASTGKLFAEVTNDTKDLLAITGGLDLSATGDLLDVTFSGVQTLDRYVLATYTGALAGQFDTLSVHNWTGPGLWSQDYSVSGELAILLPEPASLGLLGAGVMGLTVRRRPRRG